VLRRGWSRRGEQCWGTNTAQGDGGNRKDASGVSLSDEFGYYAVFLDNVGNRLGLWSQT